MSVYSLNQVRHLYVANKSVEATAELANIGDFKVKTCSNIEKEVYFEVQGPDTVLKSDYIPVKNINYGRTRQTLWGGSADANPKTMLPNDT